MIGTLFRRFDMELFDTNYERDVMFEHDYIASVPSIEAKGVRIIFK